MTPDSIDAPHDTSPSRIDCTKAARRLWDYLDGELDEARMAEVERHLAECRHCPSHFAFAESTLASIRAARAGKEDVRELQHRVIAALRTAGYANARA